MQRAIMLLSGLLAASCGDDLSRVALRASEPIELDQALALLDPAHGSLVVVDPTGTAGPDRDKKVVRLPVGESPSSAFSTPRPDDPSARQVVVLDPLGEQVVVVRDRTGRSETVSLGAPLEALAVSPDGRFGIAYQPEGVSPSHTLFTFPNAVTVLDLGLGSLSARSIRLGTAGSRPISAHFAQPMSFATVVSGDGGPTTVVNEITLAMVFVRGGIVPVDLTHGVAGTLVPLSPDIEQTVVPAEVLFTNNQNDAHQGALDEVERAYVRSATGELYVLAIHQVSPETSHPSSGLAVRVSLENIVTPDVRVRDIELFFDSDGNDLLLAAAGLELILVDGYTGVASRFAQTVRVDALVRFVDPATGQDLALGFSRDNPQRTVLRLDPLALDRRRSTGVETLDAGGPVTEIEAGRSALRAVLTYQDGLDLGILDLARTGQVQPLRFSQVPSARQLSPSGDQLWLVSVSPEDQEPYLAQVELAVLDDGRSTPTVRLDAAGKAVGRVADFLWVDHGDPSGAVTFFPVHDLRRAAAVAFRGLLYTDLFTLTPPSAEQD